MGMLLHHDWLKQQEEEKQKKTAGQKPVEEVKEEPVKEPVKKTGRGRKTK